MKYVAVAIVNLVAGAVLGLSKAQAATRTHCLAPVAGRKGWYEATGPVQFKVGEEFQFDGELPKSLAESLEPIKKDRRAEDAASVGAGNTELPAGTGIELPLSGQAGV